MQKFSSINGGTLLLEGTLNSLLDQQRSIAEPQWALFSVINKRGVSVRGIKTTGY